jgi:polyhydroxyalkanoate synthesis regulator phasin
MRKKIAIIGAVVLAVAVILVWAVPALAENSSAAQVGQTSQQTYRTRVLIRLLLVQDEAKVDTLIATAVDSGKIDEEQGARIKEFWTAHHEQFARKVVLTRIIWAQDGSKVQAFLDKAVAAGKIQPEQASKLMALWNYLHTD